MFERFTEKAIKVIKIVLIKIKIGKISFLFFIPRFYEGYFLF